MLSFSLSIYGSANNAVSNDPRVVFWTAIIFASGYKFLIRSLILKLSMNSCLTINVCFIFKSFNSYNSAWNVW